MDYSFEVERRFDSPVGAGNIEPGAPGILAVGEAADKSLNVWVRFEVQADSGIIEQVRFRAYGCPHTIAAASFAAESLRGAATSRLREFDVGALRHALNVPKEKLGKLLRIEDALRICAERLDEAAPGEPQVD